MEKDNLKLAQNGIDDALDTIELLEKTIKETPDSKNILKESFYTLSKKVDEIEYLLKNEGIL
ncbi:hypothetical protein [Clostridium sp.]|jgi:FtsZ-binding cell division protein ZapB|uniref:hypothetical protein n=1 Tax=Clostridium sp. TaxID=1506 RepID=UPI003EEECA95